MKLPPAGVWIGRGIAVLGLAAVVRAVVAADIWALVAALGGALAAVGLSLGPLVRAWLAEAPLTTPADFHHMLDLLRRAHGARAGWIVGLEESELEAVGEPAPDRAARERGAALVQLASVDGRAHVAREPAGTCVAVGDFPFGAGVLLAPPDTPGPEAERVADELRRLVAGLCVARLRDVAEQPAQLVGKQLAALAGGVQTLEGIAKAGVALAQQITQRGTAIALHGVGTGTGEARIVAVSTAADSRLEWLTLSPDAPA
ncbi:MAG TPA: hypothetical protein VFI66_00825, partial [Gemmatimonadales bacterium]|nr:hypothetical protein [Gemmatimonadales bacterium]